MGKLRVREIAERQGLNMSQLQRQSGLTMGVIRRYWYNTVNGLADGEPLQMVSLEHLNRIAEVLRVRSGALLSEDDTQEIFSPMYAAA